MNRDGDGFSFRYLKKTSIILRIRRVQKDGDGNGIAVREMAKDIASFFLC